MITGSFISGSGEYAMIFFSQLATLLYFTTLTLLVTKWFVFFWEFQCFRATTIRQLSGQSMAYVIPTTAIAILTSLCVILIVIYYLLPPNLFIYTCGNSTPSLSDSARVTIQLIYCTCFAVCSLALAAAFIVCTVKIAKLVKTGNKIRVQKNTRTFEIVCCASFVFLTFFDSWACLAP
jgi:hypothetical protein